VFRAGLSRALAGCGKLRFVRPARLE